MNELKRLAQINDIEAQGYTRQHALYVVDGYPAPTISSKSRWDRVRELGLRNLRELAAYDRGERLA